MLGCQEYSTPAEEGGMHERRCRADGGPVPFPGFADACSDSEEEAAERELAALRRSDGQAVSEASTPCEAVTARPAVTVGCTCQKPPAALPLAFVPCCLPPGSKIAKREIQMCEDFRRNLLSSSTGAPPKTQTIRLWGLARRKEHWASYREGRWIRVWRGQGHKSTIGWMKISHWDDIQLGQLDDGDCVREGLPGMPVAVFKRIYFGGANATTRCVRLQFAFEPCNIFF